MRRRRRESEEEKQQRVEFSHEFFRAVTRTDGRARPCVVCSALGAIQAHHVIEKDYVKRYVSKDPAVIWDPRNGLPVCRRCHERHTLAVRRISRRLLSHDNWEFAREHKIEHRIERSYPDDRDLPGS